MSVIRHNARMPKGPSGKIVVDLGVELKRKLYAVLSLQGKNLKQWVAEEAKKTIKSHE